MRLTWKLAVIIAVGMGTQLLLPRFVDEIDETQFAIRVLVAKWQGGSSGDPDVMALAMQLQDRQWARYQAGRRPAMGWAARGADANATTRPADKQRDASFDDDLEQYLAQRHCEAWAPAE
jgi:hypothetical protein